MCSLSLGLEKVNIYQFGCSYRVASFRLKNGCESFKMKVPIFSFEAVCSSTLGFPSTVFL
jgi:hypothetical protein